jgi:hypothetical protein
VPMFGSRHRWIKREGAAGTCTRWDGPRKFTKRPGNERLSHPAQPSARSIDLLDHHPSMNRSIGQRRAQALVANLLR